MLIEFHIDKDGKIISPTVLRAEAAPALQNAALKLMQGAKVNVKDKNFDASDTRAFDVTVRVCKNMCTSIVPFPNTADVMIAWTALR